MEVGLRWPSTADESPDWDNILAAIESEPADGPLHRAENPQDWHWYVPGYHETVMGNELAAIANWQRAGGKGQKPKPAKRPWDKEKQQRKITGDSMPTAEFEAWFEGRFTDA